MPPQPRGRPCRPQPATPNRGGRGRPQVRRSENAVELKPAAADTSLDREIGRSGAACKRPSSAAGCASRRRSSRCARESPGRRCGMNPERPGQALERRARIARRRGRDPSKDPCMTPCGAAMRRRCHRSITRKCLIDRRKIGFFTRKGGPDRRTPRRLPGRAQLMVHTASSPWSPPRFHPVVQWFRTLGEPTPHSAAAGRRLATATTL
jgi:hypothetical protein